MKLLPLPPLLTTATAAITTTTAVAAAAIATDVTMLEIHIIVTKDIEQTLYGTADTCRSVAFIEIYIYWETRPFRQVRISKCRPRIWTTANNGWVEVR